MREIYLSSITVYLEVYRENNSKISKQARNSDQSILIGHAISSLLLKYNILAISALGQLLSRQLEFLHVLLQVEHRNNTQVISMRYF